MRIISLSWSNSPFFRNMHSGFYPVRHPFHLVNPSPWPFVTSLCVLCFLLSVTMYLHSWVLGGWLSILGFGTLGLSLASWWEDVVTESTFEGHHTRRVQRGIKIGMALFIVSEVMFFFSFFWSFFYYSVSPTIWVGCVWPPLGIEAPSPWGVPFFNTALLIHSGICLTWAHFGILCNSRFSTLNGFLLTIKMGATFLGFQLFEYLEAPFSISSSVYGSIFFLATGFHGFHVTMGLVFILVCFFRYRLNHFWNTQHVGFELASWYWHFVDVVWIFLFISIYWWGGAVDSA